MRSQTYHPVAGLFVVLITGVVFWSGVALIAEKVFRLSVPTPMSAVAEMPRRS